MKLFKKLTLSLILIGTLLFSTACSTVPLNVSGYYWFKDKSLAGFVIGFEEVSVYDISFVNVTPSNTDKVENANLTYENVNGSYVTTLKTTNDSNGVQYYEYVTEYTFSADEVITDGTNVTKNPFTDTFTTKTLFNKDLFPISSHKEYNSQSTEYSCVYDITYDKDKNSATCVLTEFPNDAENKKVTNLSFNKISDGAFIDNDILLLAGRVFDISSDFSRQFKTIDVLSNKNHNMVFYPTVSDEKLDVKKIEAANGYTINGKADDADFYVAHVNLKINDTFSGYPVECYYATAHDIHRHRLIECYIKLYYDIGFIKYKLKSVTVKND